MRLISLLQNRTTFSPEEWATFDNANLNFSYNQGFLAISYSTLCVKMCGGDYGKLVSWDKEAAHRLDIIGFLRGLLVLEVQENVLYIVGRIVEQLIEELEETETTADHHDFIKIPKFEERQAGRTELWSRYTNQPFSEPPTLDIESLMSIAQAKVNSFGDHLWLMQTDPAYLRRTIRKIISAIPDRNGQTIHGVLPPRHKQSVYTPVIGEIYMEHACCASWIWISEEIKRIRDLQLKVR